jgi:hypothetical protein
MKYREWIWVGSITSAIIVLFFYQTIIFGKVPFPGDILASDFQPWRSTSYLGFGAGGVPNKAQYPDVIRQIYPWKTLVIASLKQAKLPLWNPYNFSGAPLLANFQSAVLYPLNVFYLFVSQIDAWTILIILQPVLAIIFTYLYCRKIGMKPLARWMAALSFGFSGFMAVWLEYNTVGHVILWLPLLLLAIENRSWAMLTLGNAMALLAGHPQVYAYLLVLTLLYALFRTKHILPAFAFTALGIGVAGIQLIPGIELIRSAARSPHEPENLFAKILIQPWQLLALPFPNIFGNPATRTYWPTDTFVGKVTTIGLVPLFFSFSAFRRKDPLTRWFIVATGIILVLITNNPITQLLYRIPIPVLTSSSPTLMSFLLAFSLAMVCGLGLDYWMSDTHSIKKLIRRIVEVGAIFILLFIARRFGFSTRALIYGALLSAATLSLFWVAIQFPKIRFHAVVLILIVHTLDLFVYFTRFNPFSPRALVFPNHPILSYLKEKSPDRYWGYGTANIAANFASQYRIFSPEGYDPLYPKSYGQFIYGTPIFTNTTRSDAAIASHFGDGGLSNIEKQHTLNALSVRYILDRAENSSNAKMFPPEIFTKVYAFEDWSVYENINAKPRASVEHGTARILSYEPERVIIEVENLVPGMLTLTDTYYPGWKATVDDAPATILPTDQALRQVSVPEGKHTVIMTYEPANVRVGIIVSMLSIAAIIVGLVIIKA